NSEDKKKEKKEVEGPNVYDFNTIGSDEVGTGDYFGPMVVTACYVRREDIPFLESLGIKDSKKMTDEKILEVVPKFYNKIKYSSLVLTNKEYNERFASGNNMNKLKAILHNKVLMNLKNTGVQYDYIVVDQFAEKYVYYNYLKSSSNVVRDITFLTKAEDKCLSVACASLISRFIFIKEFAKISESVGELLPKGAGTMVDEKAVKIVKKYGFDKLNEIAKINFKNTEKVKALIEND
ncbi:MAG: ribonuclease HIII, partial [Bacilli bacterium]|nr:ribonuclease HIII [Bacilli bacterium]